MIDIIEKNIPCTTLIRLDLCENSGHYYKGSCYQTIPQCQPFNIANAHCQVQGATLPVIDSAEKSLFIQERIEIPSWLKLQGNLSSSWQWRNGSSLYYTNWLSGQPANIVDHDCVVVENRGITSGWKTENCSACRNTLCEKGNYCYLLFVLIT